jgi:hypothetical protein
VDVCGKRRHGAAHRGGMLLNISVYIPVYVECTSFAKLTFYSLFGAPHRGGIAHGAERPRGREQRNVRV